MATPHCARHISKDGKVSDIFHDIYYRIIYQAGYAGFFAVDYRSRWHCFSLERDAGHTRRIILSASITTLTLLSFYFPSRHHFARYFMPLRILAKTGDARPSRYFGAAAITNIYYLPSFAAGHGHGQHFAFAQEAMMPFFTFSPQNDQRWRPSRLHRSALRVEKNTSCFTSRTRH